ncbi:hypothetical protein HYH03_001950 [Edaphochlamys debaryana]|uniref:BTB domain-containing protein n=1 Tax=Edaphochlamys debaryana TaxID=47281 RepID=A0A835YG95_9CHLO|nr:hypothetical protein HYH03_001950 [Edaphochlamys debaryana]|eukprot:KAG2500376.1 hypothetical protein HYH03_001950 [Edaphochlamys debaryana]
MILKGTPEVHHIPWGFTTRLRPGPNADGELQPETLVLTEEGSFCPLLGASSRGELSLGPALELYEKDAGGVRRAFQRPLGTTSSDPVFVPSTLSVFFCGGHAVYRLHGDNTVELVAGHPTEAGDEDGVGTNARMHVPVYLSTGSGRGGQQEGDLYSLVGEINDRVVRLELPAAWQVEPSGIAAGEVAGAGAGAGEQRVRVTTLPFSAPDEAWGLTHVTWGGPYGSLVLATSTALHRLTLGGEGPGEGGAPAPPAPAPVLLAGREGEEGHVDGRGEQARFQDICGLTVDNSGNILLADSGHGTTVVRQVTPDGTATTLGEVDARYQRPAILPNGYLALSRKDPPSLLVLDLGLKPTPLLPPAPPAPVGPPRRTLHADMGALLDAQPDGTADLILVVGGRRLPVHRAILIARCDYFRSQLEGGFADGAAPELSLPDANPAAFELLLRFVYTGAVDIPPALAPAVAELADRLLLPELCSDAQAVVLSGVSAETVVGSLLWAERLGASFLGLLSSLKAWYLKHHEEVRREAGASLERLCVESPKLMLELMDGAIARAAKRQRTA